MEQHDYEASTWRGKGRKAEGSRKSSSTSNSGRCKASKIDSESISGFDLSDPADLRGFSQEHLHVARTDRGANEPQIMLQPPPELVLFDSCVSQLPVSIPHWAEGSTVQSLWNTAPTSNTQTQPVTSEWYRGLTRAWTTGFDSTEIFNQEPGYVFM